MTRYLIKVYQKINDETMLVNAFDKEFEDDGEVEYYCEKMIDDLNDVTDDEDVHYSYTFSSDEKDLELCDFFDKCLKHAVDMVQETPKYASLYKLPISSPEELREALKEICNDEEEDFDEDDSDEDEEESEGIEFDCE